MREVVIVEAVRTPMGRRNGGLSGVHPVNLGALVLQELVARAGIDPALVEDVACGCVGQVGEQAVNIGRQAVLTAGWPITVPAMTVDRQCGSSQQAIHIAANLVAAGVVDVAVGMGVESMSRVPMGTSTQVGGEPFPPELLGLYELTHQGISAEKIARQWGISRRDCDEFGALSQQRALRARSEGLFAGEIVPVSVSVDGERKTVTEDEGIRPGTTADTLANLKPSFLADGVLTAGNSSQITDGAAAVLLMTVEKAQELGLTPRARIVAQAVVGSDPELMLTGPITATPKVLDKAGLKLSDIDVIEINEAFASVVLAWERELRPDMEKVNPNGGAIALGHPLGATGARLMTTMLHHLERTGGRFGLQTMCCGGGLATATIIERME
jgi:acetyl-CoA acyltransferase